MAEQTDASAEILKVNYLDGGSRSFSEEIEHVKYKGSIDLTIQDFLAWSEFKEDNFVYKSSPAKFEYDQATYEFQLILNMNKKIDDNISFYLFSMNSNDTHVAFDLVAIDSETTSRRWILKRNLIQLRQRESRTFYRKKI